MVQIETDRTFVHVIILMRLLKAIYILMQKNMRNIRKHVSLWFVDIYQIIMIIIT